MSKLDINELAGGLFLTITGAGFASYALMHYSVGTVTKMGPGMVPAALGVLLAIFGLVVMGMGLFSEAQPVRIRVVVPAIVLLSVLVFALVITPFGLIPAVISCVIVATLAEKDFRPVFSLTLAAILSVFAWLVFSVALQLPMTLFAWPL